MKVVPPSLTHSCRCLNSSPSLPGPELEREFKSFLRDSASSSQQCQEAQRDLMRAFQAAQESTMTVSGEGGRKGLVCVTLWVQGNLRIFACCIVTSFNDCLYLIPFVLLVVMFATLVTASLIITQLISMPQYIVTLCYFILTSYYCQCATLVLYEVLPLLHMSRLPCLL